MENFGMQDKSNLTDKLEDIEFREQNYDNLPETMQKFEAEIANKTIGLKREDELRDSILNSLSNGVFAYTIPEHKILIINEEARRIFAIPDNEIIALNQYIVDEVMKPNRDAIIESVMQLKKPGDSAWYRLHIPKTKAPLLIEVITKLLEFDDGQQFILSTMQDITETERLSRTLQEERRQYRDALIKNSEYFYSFDVTDGFLKDDIILPDGTGLVSTLGLTLPVRYDDFWKTSVINNKITLLTSNFKNYITCKGIIDAFNCGITNVTVEHYMGSRDEYTRTVMLFSKNKEDGHIHAFMVATNTTEDRRHELETEQKIRHQYEIANSFATLYFATWLVDLNDGTISALNVPEFANKVTDGKEKVDFSTAIKNYVENFVGDEYKTEVRFFLNPKTIRTRIRNRTMISCDFKWYSNEWRRMLLIPLNTETGPDYTRMIMAVQNITVEKLKDAMAKQALVDAYNSATRANKAKTEFLSRMSHDIRTPLNAIVGMTAIAGVHLDDAERIRDCLSKINVASSHLLGLINEVLDMSKIESGRLDLQVEPFTIPDLLETLVTLSRPQIENNGHDFTVSTEIKHEDVVGDTQRLQQAFMNLISNAIKYTPDGGKIKVTVTEKPTNKKHVGCFEFIIEDNGIGMSVEYMTKMFEPFSRAEDERVLKIQGTGLGMSITKNIIQMMNGDIKVESRLNEGTKITVTIFLELQDEKAIARNKMINKAEFENKEFSLKMFETSPFAGKRVLLVEDNEINMEIAVEILQMAKLNVETAKNGKVAVEKVSESPDGYYDIIFMDIQMPIMTGHEATKLIRALGRDYTNKIPIIAMTANAFSDDIIASKNAGMNEHIAKPLKFELLWQVLNRWLG